MTTTTLSPTAAAVAIAAAREARDEAMAKTENSSKADVDKALIDDVIAIFARSNRLFSANDVRGHLPDDVNQSLIGNRFMNAAKAGVIRHAGDTTSTKRSTHAKAVGCWIGATQ